MPIEERQPQEAFLEARFSDLLEAAPDAIVIVGADGRIVLVNAQAETLFGYTRSELIGESPDLLVPRRLRDRHTRHRAAYAREPKLRPMGAGMDLFGLRKDGSEFPVEISLSPLETDEGLLVFTAIRDITEQRNLQRELSEQYLSLQTANRLKSEFLANMSHELRTPLNAIIGFSELLHDARVGPVTTEQREFLGDILASSRHLLQLINDILDLAKVESGRIELVPEPIDLGPLIGEVRDILRTMAAQRRIRIEVHVAPTLTGVVADAAKLKQVLYNYLSNALKFSPEGGVIEVRVLPEGTEELRIEVEDRGIGIQPKDIDRLFVEFQQLDASTAKKFQGTGLGLALTRRVVEAQGGRVGVESTPGVGSVFYAVLPRVSPGSADYRVEPPPVQDETSSRRLLVIEDDENDRGWLVRTLADAGYSVDSASDGAEALLRCCERAYDAITLDLMLPDIPGRNVLRAVRGGGLNRGTPVIVVSVVAEQGIGLSFPVHDVFEKPVQAEELLASLSRAAVKPEVRRPVLVVDDDETTLKLVQAKLLQEGYRPVCCSTGPAALKAAAAEMPAAVVLDIVLPGMSGFEFLRIFRSTPEGRHTPVIVWTVKDLVPAEREALRASTRVVLSKGDGLTSLIQEIESLFTEPKVTS